MDKKQRTAGLAVFGCAALLFLAGALFTGGGEHSSIQETMRDAVLHTSAKVSLFGLKDVNPGLISAFTVTGILTVLALGLRIFVIPRFRYRPGRLQLLLEQAVGLFDGLAKGSSPHRNRFLGAYVFAAGVYIFVGTLFELLGLQAVTTAGHSVSLPAPLSDVNGAIAMGFLSYGVILSGGIAGAGLKGVGRTRALDERAERFLDQFGGHHFVLDAQLLGLGRLSPAVAEYFNALLLHPVTKQLIAAMADIRMHPMSYRRYMWKFAY